MKKRRGEDEGEEGRGERREEERHNASHDNVLCRGG